MANTGRSFRRSGPKRATVWDAFSVHFASVTALLLNFAVVTAEATLESFPNPTLIRQRGSYLVYANAGGTTLDSHVHMGMYFANNAAIAAGIASLQLPGTDFGSDWIWWSTCHIADNSGTLDQN